MSEPFVGPGYTPPIHEIETGRYAGKFVQVSDNFSFGKARVLVCDRMEVWDSW